LHALSYTDRGDVPIIQYHSIVYPPSNNVLKEFVERVLSHDNSSSLRAGFFCRYPEDQPAANASTKDVESIFSARGAETTITSGTVMTQATLKGAFADADLLHIHGHTAGRDLERCLVLDSGDGTSVVEPSIRYTAGAGLHPFLWLSELQEASKKRMQNFAP
jgi:hypothetical protein